MHSLSRSVASSASAASSWIGSGWVRPFTTIRPSARNTTRPAPSLSHSARVDSVHIE